jgi:uncharacterized membrane protein
MKVNQIINFINQKSRLILWSAIVLYFLIFSLICIWKYYNFGYNGLDLAIFNQTFYNSAQGNLYGLTIHPPTYLGDHFDLFIILLLPFYFLYQHPINLLILQSFILALCAWPIYLIAKKVLANHWALFIALTWLLNPFVQNINIFEFHTLVFAVFFLLWVFYFYQQKNLAGFLVFVFLAFLVREDVPLVVIMFSLLAWLDKRSRAWIIWPAVLSVGWFVFATSLVSHLTPAGTYKFLYYYSWLGKSFGEIIANFFAKPLLVLSHFFSANNLVFILALLLPFAFIFFEVKYLLLGLLIFLQLTIGGSNNSLIVLKTHYSALLLPALYIGLIYGLIKFLKPAGVKLSKLKSYLVKEKPLIVLLILGATVYASVTLGPLPTVAKRLFKPVGSEDINNLKTQFYQSVPPRQAVATAYDFLTMLSSRPRLYSLHYAFIGKKQFSNLEYKLPDDTQVLLFDFNDCLTYSVQFPNSQQWKNYYPNGDDNFRKIIKEGKYGITKISDTLVKMEKNVNSDLTLYQAGGGLAELKNYQNLLFDNGLIFLGWSTNLPYLKNSARFPGNNLYPVSLYFKTREKLDKDYQLKLMIKNKNGRTIRQKYYPLAYGLYPTSEWRKNENVKINYWFLIPSEFAQTDYYLELQLVYLEGFLKLDGLRTAVPDILKESLLEPTIKFPEL